MTDYDTIATDYLRCWNDTDTTSRRKRLEQLCTPDATYTDPNAGVTGLDQLDGVIAAVQGQFPNFRFRLAGPADGHGDQLRFTWELGEPDQEAPVVGFDVVTLDGDGRIDRVLGFLDKVPG